MLSDLKSNVCICTRKKYPHPALKCQILVPSVKSQITFAVNMQSVQQFAKDKCLGVGSFDGKIDECELLAT